MFTNKIIFISIIAGILLSSSLPRCHKDRVTTIATRKDSIVIGAYYFDGWTGKTDLIAKGQEEKFPERKPVWGWVTSTAPAVAAQIDLAADAGISFFNFCWYYPGNGVPESEPLNHALGLYLRSPNKSRLKFSLLVANHEGYIIGPDAWAGAMNSWIRLFKDPDYLSVEGKPYITFFSLSTLLRSFGSAEKFHEALDLFRSSAVKEGLPGVTIALATGPGKERISEAEKCGFDVLTSYNDHDAGFEKDQKEIRIEKLSEGTTRVWNQFKRSALPYVPAVTLAWDLRLWSPQDAPYYIGYSGASVYASVRSVRRWIDAHPGLSPGQKMAMLYAWNEYGEGAWLTPSEPLKDSLLQGVKKALEGQ